MFPQGIDNLYKKKADPAASAPAKPAPAAAKAEPATAPSAASAGPVGTGRFSRMRVEIEGKSHEVTVEEV